jgi:glycosyltransferase involved in cell wall biosynthesis
MMKKRYAVFIPCYNAARTIELTLQSVQQAIEALGVSIPVFVYDDCSKDASTEIVKRFSQQYPNIQLRQNAQNSGERKTTNQAFLQFRQQFDWIFIIHADDIAKDNWLTELMKYTEQEDDTTCFTVWSSYDILHEKDGSIETGKTSGQVHTGGKDMAMIRYYISKISASWHLSGCAINAELYCRLNGFHENMPQFGDTDFFVRGLLAGYTHVYLASSLTTYRMTPGGVSSVSFRTNRDIREIYMLIEQYRNLLDKKGVATMYSTITKISGRRAVKWLLRREFRLAFQNLRQFGQSITQFIMFKFRTINASK